MQYEVQGPQQQGPQQGPQHGPQQGAQQGAQQGLQQGMLQGGGLHASSSDESPESHMGKGKREKTVLVKF